MHHTKLQNMLFRSWERCEKFSRNLRKLLLAAAGGNLIWPYNTSFGRALLRSLWSVLDSWRNLTRLLVETGKSFQRKTLLKAAKKSLTSCKGFSRHRKTFLGKPFFETVGAITGKLEKLKTRKPSRSWGSFSHKLRVLFSKAYKVLSAAGFFEFDEPSTRN